MAKKKQKKRRSYGIGRKFLRGSVWWIAIHDGSGNEIRESTKSSKESDADDLLGQRLRERSRGELVSIDAPSGSLNTGAVLDEFLLRRESLAPGTLNTCRYQVKSLLKPYFGLIPPAKITTDMFSDTASSARNRR